jgi:RNA methyltransferase, TrmH family
MNKKPKVQEQKYYGIHACYAIFDKRPDDIIKVYIHSSNLKFFAPLLKMCAKFKKAYHIVDNEDLEKLTNSTHHEGVCIVAKELKPIQFETFIKNFKETKACLLYLDGVQNPHNIGSILRTCAHFGVSYILGNKLPTLSPSACRIAKGAAEIVQLVQVDAPQKALEFLKKIGFGFIGTSSHAKTSLYTQNLPDKSIFVFGAEDVGMSHDLSKHMTINIQIPGTGFVESLNVSVATSLCIGEYSRQHQSFT